MILLYILVGILALIFVVIAIIIIAALLTFRDYNPDEFLSENL